MWRISRGCFFNGYPGGSGLTSGAVFGRMAGYGSVLKDIKMKKIKVAILDDYQNVSHKFADWNVLK